MAFDLDDNDNDNDGNSSGDAAVNTGALPLGYIHVRGAGTNQFGTFEIIGGYNVKTGVLSCQRIYVTTTDGDAKAKADTDKNKEKVKGSVPTPMRKSYFTRKRPVSFKRPGYDNDNDNDKGTDEGKKRMGGGSAKKRPRVAPPEPTPVKDDNVPAIVTTIASASILPTAAAAAASAAAAISPPVPLPPITIQSPPVKVPAPVAAVAKPPTRRPSPNKGSSRKTKSSPQSGGRSGQLANAFHIPIPKVGNAQEARWRSSHYLYYLRHADETSNSPSNSSNNPVTPAKTSYVVYEGEMNGGHSIRDGKGVCLYNNNMIYEGEWKKNKEHGYGSLFNGDRSQTIYVGDWERGKMVSLSTYIC